MCAFVLRCRIRKLVDAGKSDDEYGHVDLILFSDDRNALIKKDTSSDTIYSVDCTEDTLTVRTE